MNDAILVVEDDVVTRRLLERALGAARFVVHAVASFREAEATLNRSSFAVILLDRLLPDGDGLVLCSRIRTRWRTPVIIVTSRGETEDIVAGLECGADDYVAKPFDVRTVVARVKAQIRRAGELSDAEDDRPLQFGALSVDARRRDAFVNGRAAGLTAKQFDLIHFLAQRHPRPVHKDALFDELWGDEEQRSEKILAVYVRHIRRKIEDDPDAPVYLCTIRGYGYALAAAPALGGETSA